MHILAIDQGTTGTTTVLFDQDGRMEKKSYRAFRQIYPRPGWVEHDALEIWQTVIDSVTEVLAGFKGTLTGVA